jgi:hypothetical protein
MKVLAVPTSALLGAAALALASSAAAQTTGRLTDKDVKALIEAVDNSRDHFEDKLDGKVKDSILRGSGHEVKVDKFLEDFEENVERLKDRFESTYAASVEVGTVLRQATAIDNFMKQQPTELKGASEWQHFVVDLSRLAAAYGATFPLENDSAGGPAAVRRINDGEAAMAAAKIEEHADDIKDAFDEEQRLEKPAKNRLKDAAHLVKERAESLKSRLEDSAPSTAEAKLLFDAVRSMEESAKGLNISPESLTAMGLIKAPLETLHQAFRM